MGRKKRKVEEPKAEVAEAEEPPKQEEATGAAAEDKPKKSSSYGLTSHAGIVIGADHSYISDSDSRDSEEEDVDVVLSNSKTGLMRRGGLLQHALPVQHKQWVRLDAEDSGDALQQQEEEDLSLLDPEEREARLQAAQERAEMQEKQAALLKEAQHNAGRDPALFSKRTAFDIRFDQMEDKPWTRATDLSDYFNYNLTEEAWLEYAAQQMTIRQELQDAARSKRPPDPHIVPVTPAAPASQAPKVAVAGAGGEENLDSAVDGTAEAAATGTTTMTEQAVPAAPVGPVRPDPGVVRTTAATTTSDTTNATLSTNDIGGGAWGAGAPPGSYLARLMEEQLQAGNNNKEYEDKTSEYGGDSFQQDYRRGGGGRGGRGGGHGGRGGWSGRSYDNDDSYLHNRNKRPRDDWRR